MNITKESTGSLTATIKIELLKEDYQENVNKVLKDFQHKANIPGFRPGKVPAGMIRKMYGKAVMADEINKLISDSLSSYITNEKLDLLGNPLPNMEKTQIIDFDREDISYDFYFDIGFAPVIEVNLAEQPPMERYLIQVSDEMVNHYIEDTRKRYGTHVEKKEEDGGKKEEEIKNEPEIIPAELNPEFFEKVYPGKEIKTEEEFREQVRKDAAESFIGESDNLFYRQVSDKLIKSIPVDLPDDFLKRWLLDQKESKLTTEEIEKQYDAFAESMKWQLIENKILRDNDIKVTDEDIRDYIRNYFLRQIPMDKEDPEVSKKYDSLVDVLMQNKEQVRKINDELFTKRLIDLFKSKLKVEDKEISYEEFIKFASSTPDHILEDEHDHEHEHEHEHEHPHDHEHEHDHEH